MPRYTARARSEPCPICHGLGRIDGNLTKPQMVEEIRALRDSGHTLAQIATAIGRSVSTVEKYCSVFGIRKKTVIDLGAADRDIGQGA